MLTKRVGTCECPPGACVSLASWSLRPPALPNSALSPWLLAPQLLRLIFLLRFLKIVLFYNLYTSNSAPGSDVQALVSPFFLVCVVSSPLGPK